MRKSLLFLLLAGASVPAFAAEEHDDQAASREAARAERAEARGERGERRAVQPPPSTRTGRSLGARAIGPSEGDCPALREAVRDRMGDRRSPRINEAEAVRPMLEPSREDGQPRVREWRDPRMVEVEPVRPTLEQGRDGREQRVREHRGPRMVEVDSSRPTLGQRDGSDSVREWRRAERGSARSPALVEQRTDSGWEPLRKRTARSDEGLAAVRAPIVSRTPREGTQPPARAEARGSRLTTNHWRGDWRSDRRYDWRRHRDRHRSLFRFSFYYDPFGWSYRPYSIGWRLWPSYYRSSYWLHDPWTYRLPYAPPGYRWIRYYDDVLLVDTWDGRVVDVIRNFFW